RLPAAELRDLIVDRQHAPRVSDNHLPARGQAHARGALVEELVTEQKLQPLDLRADRRLGDAERLRRFGEAALIDDEHECPQKFSRDIDHAPSPLLRVSGAALPARPTAADPFRAGGRPHSRTAGNVCAIALESSAAINVVSTFEIGKYCVIN